MIRSLGNGRVIRLSVLQLWPLDVALEQRAAFTLIPEFSCSERAETKPAVIGCFLCWLCKQRAWLKCERCVCCGGAVPDGRSVASLWAACAEELELQSDLLCHPDFGSCYFRFLFGFWKLPLSSPAKRPLCIGTHPSVHPQPKPAARWYKQWEQGGGFVICDHRRVANLFFSMYSSWVNS